MKYTGPLFGKIGRRYVPLKMTSAEVDAMSAELAQHREALALAREALEACDTEVDSWGIPHQQIFNNNKVETALAAINRTLEEQP